MQEQSKILQGLGIPHSAFLSVIFGMMLLSFPMGMFVFFNSDIGDDINFEYPLVDLGIFNSMNFEMSLGVTVGDAFIILWSLYAIFFAIGIFGPVRSFIQTLLPTLSRGMVLSSSNYLVASTKWFSILILVSAVITFAQDSLGVPTLPPQTDNDLIQFFYVTLAPLTEEIAFRVILLGIPIFLISSHFFSVRYFFKFLWSPSKNLHNYNFKIIIFLIITVGMIFGFAHVATGEPWSEGKFAQASAGGIILGWLYFRFGLLPAVLVHWATNYFIFSYANFVSQVNEITLEAAFYHPLISVMEILFLISGVLSVSILVVNYLHSRKPTLEI